MNGFNILSGYNNIINSSPNVTDRHNNIDNINNNNNNSNNINNNNNNIKNMKNIKHINTVSINSHQSLFNHNFGATSTRRGASPSPATRTKTNLTTCRSCQCKNWSNAIYPTWKFNYY